MHDQHVTKKTSMKLSQSNMHIFSLRAKYAKKYFFSFVIVIILFVPLFASNRLGPLLQSIRAQSPSPSFTFTAGGDFGGNSRSAATLNLIAQSGSAFHLAIGDLSYSEITPESAWCSYVQSYLGSTF